MTLKSIISTDANSYCDLDFAKKVYADTPSFTSNTFTDDKISTALITATLRIEAEYAGLYLGELHNPINALSFPRVGINDKRGVPITDFSDYPNDIKIATAYQAYYEISSNVDAEATDSVIRKEKIGDMSVEYDTSTSIKAKGRKIDDMVEKLLSFYIEKPKSLNDASIEFL